MEQDQGAVIVAMKGYICSGKTTLARKIAAAHKWPLINEDYVPAHEATLQQYAGASPITATEHLNDPYEAICQIALTQLELGISVIIDSPLSHQTHLDRLLQLSTSTGARLIIVECRPRDKYEWRNRIEQRVKSSAARRYSYKPSTWEAVQMILEQHDAISDCEVRSFSKLVVDTTRYFRDSDLCRAVDHLASYQGTIWLDFDDWNGAPFRLGEGEGEGEGGGEGEGEGKGEGKGKGKGNGNTKPDVLGHFHRLTLDGKQKNYDEVGCRACLRPISDVAYNCNGCDLSVHTLCAELPNKREIPPQNYPSFLHALLHEYSFPETKDSNFCETHKNNFYECSECLFKTNLRCGLLPSVLLHSCHEHPLCISFYPISYNYKFKCKACSDPGQNVSYNCSKCSFVCHPSCALLPTTIKTPGHFHPAYLRPSEADADYSEIQYCHICETERDPMTWSYLCRHCYFFSHLQCAASVEHANVIAYTYT